MLTEARSIFHAEFRLICEHAKEIFNRNRMLFGMPKTKYVLNNKSFKALERGSFKCLSTFHIL